MMTLEEKILKFIAKTPKKTPAGTVTVTNGYGHKKSAFDVPEGFQLDRFVMSEYRGHPEMGEIQFKMGYERDRGLMMSITRVGRAVPEEIYSLLYKKAEPKLDETFKGEPTPSVPFKAE